MKNVMRVSVFSLLFAFLFTIGVGHFTESDAWEKRRNPTKTGLKATGHEKKEKAVAHWDSLSPEQQEFYEQKAKERASTAKMTGQEYWNSLPPEEQEQAIERSRSRAEKGRKRWQSLPE